MRPIIFTLLFFFIIFSSCDKKDEPVFKNELVQVKGTIANYKGVYKTGKLTYFDAVSRMVNNKIFKIDSFGKFEISFDLMHPIINSIYFDIENEFYSNFYIEPGKKYNVTIKESKLFFNGETGDLNNKIVEFKDFLSFKLEKKIAKSNALHQKGLSIEDYLVAQKEIELEKLEFLDEFNMKYSFDKDVLEILKNEIKFKTAHSWINYRYDYSSGRPVERDTLPNDFYNDLFQEYPINTTESYQSRVCIDYISNIVSVLQEEGKTNQKRIEFYKTFNLFSSEHLEVLSKLYNGDKNILKSNAFKDFNSQENIDIERTLSYRYNIHTIFENITWLNNQLIRDLVLSQSIARNYFLNNINPTVSEWELLGDLIENEQILSFLKNFPKNKRLEIETTDVLDEDIKKTITEVKEKYVEKYLGKVIYIDFYATWCGPCRIEIPFAKSLHYEFENEDVVFLNLCAQSKKENWKNFLLQNNIQGENYLLSNEEYYLLSELYNVKGFPTYVLIDKKGKVVNYEAPRPSSKSQIIDEINKLLK